MSTRLTKAAEPREPTEREIREASSRAYDEILWKDWDAAAQRLGMTPDQLVRRVVISELREVAKLSQKEA